MPAPVHVASPDATRGIVCDIDDTVWITGIRHPLRAAWRTFAGNGSTRRPVAGMASLLSRLVEDSPNAPVIYLSNGPWNLAASRLIRPTSASTWGPIAPGSASPGAPSPIRPCT